MMKKQELICINCPLGCHLEVTKTEPDGWLVEGNQCNRGKTYAIKELTAPTRILTTTVIINNGILKRLPVRTNEALPKDKIFEAMKLINKITVNAPIEMGEVIITNILDTGVDIIASRSMGDIVNNKTPI
jgi:CxxC motif-containing protein